MRKAVELLEAVKWIGNQGTHEDSLTVADVLKSAAFLHRALELLYETRVDDSDILDRAKRINEARKKSPPTPREL